MRRTVGFVRARCAGAICFIGLLTGCGPTPDAIERSVRDTLDRQQAAWNRGDIDGFMAGYWRSPDLTFSAGGRTTRGWAATRDRYKAKYDTRAKMGALEFSKLEVRPLDARVALVLGRWRLRHEHADVAGNFSLVMTRESTRWNGLRRKSDSWVVLHDHTSLDEPATSAPSTTRPAAAR